MVLMLKFYKNVFYTFCCCCCVIQKPAEQNIGFLFCVIATFMRKCRFAGKVVYITWCDRLNCNNVFLYYNKPIRFRFCVYCFTNSNLAKNSCSNQSLSFERNALLLHVINTTFFQRNKTQILSIVLFFFSFKNSIQTEISLSLRYKIC